MDQEREQAEANAPRMAHMSSNDIRAAIASLKAQLGDSGTFGMGVGIGAMSHERHNRSEIETMRTELVRRICVGRGLPFLTRLDMTALRQAAADGKVSTSNPGIILKCLELRSLGLMMERTRDLSGEREFRLTPMGQQVVDHSSEDAVNLLDAVRKDNKPSVSLDTVAALVCADIAASYAESIRTDDQAAGLRSVPAAAAE